MKTITRNLLAGACLAVLATMGASMPLAAQGQTKADNANDPMVPWFES